MEYRIANPTDIVALQRLLEKNHLPSQDLESSSVFLIVSVENNGLIIGCIGLEKYGKEGLLRSFAVDDHYKSQGIGNELFNKLIEKSRSENIQTLHLLTTTAEKYFTKRHFTIANRSSAPDSIKLTSEFSTICPATATYMTLKL